MWSQFTNVTDRQTDRQTTCDRNTALCTKVHRAVKKHSAGRTTLVSLSPLVRRRRNWAYGLSVNTQRRVLSSTVELSRVGALSLIWPVMTATRAVNCHTGIGCDCSAGSVQLYGMLSANGCRFATIIATVIPRRPASRAGVKVEFVYNYRYYALHAIHYLCTATIVVIALNHRHMTACYRGQQGHGYRYNS